MMTIRSHCVMRLILRFLFTEDTVYLLLPTQTLRPTHGLPHIIPDWQTRRRRRRYDSYAEYAVIPEKADTSNACIEERDRTKKGVQHANSRKNSNQSSKRMNSFPETGSSSGENPVPTKNSSDSESNQMQRPPLSVENSNSRDNMSLNTEMGEIIQNSAQKPKKGLEMCGVHTKKHSERTDADINESQSLIQAVNIDSTDSTSNHFESINEELIRPKVNINASDKDPNSLQEESSDKVPNVSPLSSVQDLPDIQTLQIKCNSSVNKVEDTGIQNDPLVTSSLIETDIKTSKGNCDKLQDNKFDSERDESTQSVSEPQSHTYASRVMVDNILSHNSVKEKQSDESCIVNSQSSLPDILSTVNKSLSNNMKTIDSSFNSNRLKSTNFSEKTGFESDKGLKSKSLSHSILPNLLSSDSLHNEMEIELKQLTHLQSLQTNQSIYKLAYDENVTDQSEADSRSPSPIDPESQVPRSITNAEILIHEADSGSEAGSEDIELKPHRYESETFLNENKHMYVNKLSLAVELLRTQESLPYDDEFKRVVGDNNHVTVGIPPDTRGKVNLGFVDDSYPPRVSGVSRNFNNMRSDSSTDGIEGIRQPPQRLARQSVICREVSLDDSAGESCEVAREVTPQMGENQDSTEEVIAGYRRFGVQAHHYFSPRAALVNPCFCCIIM